MNQRKTKKYMGYSGLLVILLIAIDQFTKWLAYTHLYQKPDVSVIDGVFQLKYLENDSAAFSLDPVSILHRIFHFSYFDSHPEAFLMAKMIFFAVLTIVVSSPFCARRRCTLSSRPGDGGNPPRG